MKVKIVSFLFTLLGFSQFVFGQGNIPVGTWRTHFSYTDVLHVARLQGDDKVFAATANGIFYIDEADNSINKITKIDGLSDAGISSLKPDDNSNTLAIGYNSGIIDFLSGNELTAFTDLAIATQLENKSILDIEFGNNRIYIATSIGVVVLDNTSKEIIESYAEIGPEASSHPISDLALSSDSIYLASPIGLLVASLDPSLNLQDFNNWSLKTPNFGLSGLTQIQWLGNELRATTGSSLVSYQNGTWSDLTGQLSNGPHEFILLSNTQSQVIGQRSNVSTVFDENLSIIDSYEIRVNDVLSSSSTLFLGSLGASLIRSSANGDENLAPSGPSTDDLSALSFQGGLIYGIGEFQNIIKEPIGKPGEYSSFDGNQWSINEIEGVNDLSSVSYNGQPIWGVYGQGIYNEAEATLIDEQTQGSPFLPPPNSDFGPFITDVYHDADGQLWVANYDANPSVHVFDESASWSSISLGLGSSARFPEQLVSSQLTKTLWARIDPDRGGGIYVFDPGQQSVRYLTAPSSDLPSTSVNDIAIDKNDEVWVGTNAGVAFFQSSQSPFIPDFADAIVPIFNGELLLKDEYISDVAVDGGNRKWFGSNIGLWLFSENGDELIHHFTTSNSPMPSDTISDITINPNNGEVFVSTTKGLISYRSDATDAAPIFTTVKVFPNPVTPDYNGLIGFSGLASDVNVKVTDVSGRLVREFFASGGSASWDGLDINSKRVSTGVYLIFSSDALGQETFVGKFAVVR